MYNVLQFIIATYFFIVGCAIGSFLNVVIDRLTFGKSLLGRSKCDHCGKTLEVKHLIPLFSFLYQSGNTTCCKKTKLSMWYPFTELITGIIFVCIWFVSTELIIKLFFLVILSCLIVIVISDIKYQLIADEVQMVLLVSIFLYILYTVGITETLFKHVIGLLVVPLPLLAIYIVSKGKAMGFADVKLATNMGLLFGAPLGFVALYMSFILGAFFGILFIMLKKKTMASEMAFGPFLVFGSLMVFIWKNIFTMYINQYVYLFIK